MLGGVFGDSSGIAPGYTLSLSYKWIELFTQGEYFVEQQSATATSSIHGLSKRGASRVTSTGISN